MTDIEQALAEALAYAIEHHEHHDSVAIVACGRGRLDYCIPAILVTPQMQAIARQAAIGAAVERFHERFGCWYLEWNDTVSVGTQGYKYSKPTVRAKARTIPEAIAAALGEDA